MSPRPASAAITAAARHPWRTALAAASAALLALVLLWDWNWFKGAVERAVQARTGRTFEIAGDLRVRPGRVVTLRADALRLGDASWSERAAMATVDSLELRLDLPALLLRRQARIPELRLVKPRVHLEVGPEGTGNWDFGGDGDGRPPWLQRLWIDDGRLRYTNAERDTDIELTLATRQPRHADAAPPVEIEGEGRWRGSDFSVEGAAESPLELQQDEDPYRIDLRARAGATRARARGGLSDALRLRNFDLRLALSGQDMQELYPLLGLAMPPTPPYDVDGRLLRDGDTWRYDGFSGKVGDSDLSGTASVTMGGERPYFRADLISKLLDFDDLAGFVGGTPQAGPGETANPEQRTRARERADSGRVLPDTPYDLDRLHAMDAEVRLGAQRIRAPSLPLDRMQAHLLLEDGLLRLDPLELGVAGGDIRANIRMDAREAPIDTRVDAELRRLDLGRMFPGVKLAQDTVGALSGSVALSGTGNSVAQMLGNADGEIALGVGRGRISALLVELAGIDVAEALAFLITGDRSIPVRCAFGDFAVQDGVMQARALAFDTTDTILIGEGSIDLGEESFDLVLRPRPKDRSILTLRSPLVVDGTFADPGFHPDMGKLGLRGALAIALGSIAPPAALLATMDLGGGEDSDCGGEHAK